MELITAHGAGELFKLSPFTIRRLGYRGAIKEYRCGKAVRYSPEEIMRWMAGSERKLPLNELQSK
ncbi:MAG: hypothetical protein OJF52_003489 [Nitrospira sp.]|jgi:hypothetical protein|nr:MAG: hypothetical protein OJF52_003489 [Nitrospira sp.]